MVTLRNFFGVASSSQRIPLQKWFARGPPRQVLPFGPFCPLTFGSSGRAKGAAKGSCGETVVQKGVLESPFLLCPLKVFSSKHLKGLETLREQRRNGLSKTPFWTTVSPQDPFAASFGAPPALPWVSKVLVVPPYPFSFFLVREFCALAVS